MNNKNILLTMLPYWSPVIPPAGLSTLKSYLQPYGYQVRIIDFNTKLETLTFYYDYLRALRKSIPPGKRGTFYNMGHEVLEKHLIAIQKYEESKDDKKYRRLVKLLIFNTYYAEVDDGVITKLHGIIKKYLERLRDYFLFLLDYEKPGVLGVTLYKTTLPLSLFVLKLAKAHCPGIKTAAGGSIFADSHREGSPGFAALLRETGKYLDKVIVGEGEVLLRKYLEGEFPEEQRVLTPKDLAPGEALSLDNMPIPDFSEFSMKKYSHLVATASRGCPCSCSFCNEKGFFGAFRKRNPAKTVDAMMTMSQQYKRKLFFMTDSLLNPVIDDLAAEMINNKTDLYMDTYFRIDHAAADLERTLFWRRGGLYRVRLGVESGSDRMLERMNKGITTAQIRAALPKLAEAGIKTTTYWLMGHPDETEADFQQTLDLVEELKDYIWQAECNAFRYYCDAHNSDDQWKDSRTPLYPEELDEMLVFKTYTLDLKPSRKEAYNRVFRFINHCKKLGIPNPYSGYEGFEADRRWKELHKNSVPNLEDLGNHDTCDKGKNILLASGPQEPEKDFNF